MNSQWLLIKQQDNTQVQRHRKLEIEERLPEDAYRSKPKIKDVIETRISFSCTLVVY